MALFICQIYDDQTNRIFVLLKNNCDIFVRRWQIVSLISIEQMKLQIYDNLRVPSREVNVAILLHRTWKACFSKKWKNYFTHFSTPII